MGLTTDIDLYAAECAVLVALVGFVGLRALTRRLTSPRPTLAIAWVLVAAFAVRVVATLVVSSVDSLDAARGPDDAGFLDQADVLGHESLFSRAWSSQLTGGLQLILSALPFRVLDAPGDLSIRVVHVSIAVAAIAIVAAAVHDLVGPRAAIASAWVLTLEPSHVFFSGLVHKEATMFAAEALVLLGTVRMWQRRDLAAGTLIVAGCAVAAGIRPHVAGALAAAAFVVTALAAWREPRGSGHRSRPLLAVVAAVGVIGLVTVAIGAREQLSSFERVQESTVRLTGNLNLEPIDTSSPTSLALALPIRVVDLLTRPYPWQIANVSQGLGALGTLVAWLLIAVVLALSPWRRGRALWALLPLVLLTVAIACAYALGLSNAGTGFRHRTHFVMFVAVLAAILLATVTGARRTSERDSPAIS